MAQPQTIPVREAIPLTPRIVRLDADPQDYIISAVFETGETRRFDVKPLLDRGVFRRIRNRQAFTTVHIDDLGGVAWDAGPDLCRDTIYFEGIPG